MTTTTVIASLLTLAGVAMAISGIRKSPEEKEEELRQNRKATNEASRQKEDAEQKDDTKSDAPKPKDKSDLHETQKSSGTGSFSFVRLLISLVFWMSLFVIVAFALLKTNLVFSETYREKLWDNIQEVKVFRERAYCEEVRKVTALNNVRTAFDAIPLTETDLPLNSYGFDSPPCGSQVVELKAGCLGGFWADDCSKGGGSYGQVVQLQFFWTDRSGDIFSSENLRPFKTGGRLDWKVGTRFPFYSVPNGATHFVAWVVRENVTEGGIKLFASSRTCPR